MQTPGVAEGPSPSWREVDRVEREAFGDLFAAAPPELVGRLGIASRREGSTLMVAARHLDQPKMNRAVGLGSLGAATEGQLDAAIAWLRTHAHPGGMVQVAPDEGAAEVPAWLAARGFTPLADSWARLRRGAEPVDLPSSASPLVVRLATDRDAAAFGEVVARGFGLDAALAPWYAALVGRPRWRAYLVYRGDSPVAAGSLYLGDGAGWVGTGATLPEARNLGAQTALLARRIADGLDLGLREFAAEVLAQTREGAPENASLRNARRAGFAIAYIRRNYGPIGVRPGED